MNVLTWLKKKAFNYIASDNLLNKAVFSFLPNFFFALNQNKKNYVDEGYRGNLDVYSIIKLISGKVADAKFRAVEGDKDLPLTDEVNKILLKPNEETRQQQFIEALCSWLLITGDFYIYKLRYQTGVNKGKVARLYAMPSQYVQIIGGGWMNPIKAYKLIIGDQSIEFPATDVTHIKYFNPNWDINGSQLYGQSPLEAALRTIQSSNEGVNSKIKAFVNGGVAGLLSSEDPTMPMSPEQVAQLNDLISGRITGTNNTKKISATSGYVKYQKIGESPADLEVLKSLQFDANQVCKVFGVDPILFDTNSASYNNKKEAYKSLVNNVVVPILNLIKDGLDDCFIDYGKQVNYSIAHFPEMQQDLGEMVTSLEKAWWFTPNQKLEMMGKEPSKDALMDKIYIPSSYVPLDEISVPIDATIKNFDYND